MANIVFLLRRAWPPSCSVPPCCDFSFSIVSLENKPFYAASFQGLAPTVVNIPLGSEKESASAWVPTDVVRVLVFFSFNSAGLKCIEM